MPGSIGQNLLTTADRQYQVVFATTGAWIGSSDTKHFRASAAGTSQDFSVEYQPDWSATGVLWEHRSFTFTADSASTRLVFESLEAANEGGVVGDIQVFEIPQAVQTILNSDSSLSYDAAAGKFYKMVSTPDTWANAQSAAIATQLNGVNGQLVTVRSAYEQELIRSKYEIAGVNDGWLGGSDSAVEGEWRWLDGATPVDQFADASGDQVNGSFECFGLTEPNGGVGENNLEIRSADGDWNDETPSISNPYIVEWDASEVLSNFTYSLTDDSGGRFAIDPHTGEITVANGSLLDFETNSSHSPTVQVTDSAGASYSEAMQIQINDVADGVLVVNTTVDENDGNTASIASLIATPGGTGISLREAIIAANNTANGASPDEIRFNIAGAGPHTISPGSALPAITDALIIDGSSEPDFVAGAPVIEIDGSGAGPTDGLRLSAGSNGSTIRDLVINRFTEDAIDINSSDNNLITGNFLGTNTTGMSAAANGSGGIHLLAGSTSNTIGGTSAADRNVISGNALNGIYVQGVGTDLNIIQGNFIGIAADGVSDLGNTFTGVVFESGANNNTLGGAASGAENIISGNDQHGVFIGGIGTEANTIVGNLIGTDVGGTAAVGNSMHGIAISNNAANNIIGGTVADGANTLAFNTDGIATSSTAGAGNSFIGNSIHSNAELGIDLADDNITSNDVNDVDSGANDLLNFPLLTNVVQNGGNLDVDVDVDLPLGNYRIEFFDNASGLDSSGFGEGENYIGFAHISVTGAAGYETFSTSLIGVTASDVANITATATEADGTFTTFSSTSEFSPQFQGVGTLIVDTVDDTLDGDASSITALLGNRGADGSISLREAITAANNTTNGGSPDEIHFDIAGAGPHSIALGSALPTIIEAVVLDGWTEPDYGSTPVIELDGSGAGAGVNGLAFSGGGSGSTVRGFAINQFANAGIFLSNANNVIIEGNYIGTDTSGVADLGNGSSGIVMSNADANTIGGLTAASRNVISGNTSHGIDLQNGSASNTIQGNHIGTNAAGTAQLGNSNWGVAVSSGSNTNTIGGIAAGAGNVISGNTVGIDFTGAGTNSNLVLGNYIGLNAAGTANVGNISAAIVVQASADLNTIGGATAAHRNVIAGGSTDGIRINGADDTSILGNYIGTNAAGDTDRGFTQEGIEVGNSDNTVIGALGQGNVISGNDGAGIGIQSGATNTKIIANLIGTNAANSAAIANSQHGIEISGDASNTTIGTDVSGEGNTIHFNVGDGINISGTGTGHNVVGNSIASNSELGIDLGVDGPDTNDASDLDGGVNNQQNYPVLDEAVTNGSTSVTVTGSLNSNPSTNFRIDFYANSAADSSGFGEGQRHLGSIGSTFLY